MKESNYKNGFQTNKKRKSKTVTTVIVILLVSSLMLGVVGYFRIDIMDLINPSLAPTVEVPVIDIPVIDEPVIEEPSMPEEPFEDVKHLSLSPGNTAESIYVNTTIFESNIKDKLASLDYDLYPDYSGIGYNFMTVEILINYFAYDYEFVICPFMRLYNMLGYNDIPDDVDITEEDFFILIYVGSLNDWFFDDCYYSSVTANLEFANPDEPGAEPMVLNFTKGFRNDVLDAEGKLKFDTLVNGFIERKFTENVILEIGTITFVDDVVSKSLLYTFEILNEGDVIPVSKKVGLYITENKVNSIKSIIVDKPKDFLWTHDFLSSFTVYDNLSYADRVTIADNYNDAKAIPIVSYEYYDMHNELKSDVLYISLTSDFLFERNGYPFGHAPWNDFIPYYVYAYPSESLMSGIDLYDLRNNGFELSADSFNLGSHVNSYASDSYVVIRDNDGVLSLLDYNYDFAYFINQSDDGRCKFREYEKLIEIYDQQLFNILF